MIGWLHCTRCRHTPQHRERRCLVSTFLKSKCKKTLPILPRVITSSHPNKVYKPWGTDQIWCMQKKKSKGWKDWGQFSNYNTVTKARWRPRGKRRALASQTLIMPNLKIHFWSQWSSSLNFSLSLGLCLIHEWETGCSYLQDYEFQREESRLVTEQISWLQSLNIHILINVHYFFTRSWCGVLMRYS